MCNPVLNVEQGFTRCRRCKLEHVLNHMSPSPQAPQIMHPSVLLRLNLLKFRNDLVFINEGHLHRALATNSRAQLDTCCWERQVLDKT
jgi:hypothetical protein